MKNLNASEKSRGVVVFAFNTKQTDYVKIADRTSRLIEHNLALPITLVTDENAEPTFHYDNIVRVDNQGKNFRYTNSGETVEWKNLNRCHVYNLSPYSETLLLDSDYLVLDDSLNKVWLQPFDYRIMEQSITPKGIMQTHMGPVSQNWLWATVVFFRKTETSYNFFNLVEKIQKNYAYYKTLFNLAGNYRNDFSFAIADLILNGYAKEPNKYLKTKMLTIDTNVSSLEAKENFVIIRQQESAVVCAKQNIHIMDKDYLMGENFLEFVENVIS